MARKRDYSRLLAAFPDRAGKPETTERRKSIRLPSTAELLAIDARAEAAAKASRVRQVTFWPLNATGITSGPADVVGARQAP